MNYQNQGFGNSQYHVKTKFNTNYTFSKSLQTFNSSSEHSAIFSFDSTVGGQTRTVPRVKSYHGKLFFKTHTTIPPRKMTQALSRFWIYFLELITMWSTEIAIT